MKRLKYLSVILLFLLVAYSLISWFQVGSRPDKIGLHRCNSAEKLQEKGLNYALVEVDVCLRPDNTVDVTHDENASYGLDLLPYFAYLQAQPDRRLWIDVKNLNDSTQMPLLITLDSLCHTYDVRHNRIIVESRRWDLLRPFTLNDFHTSYYVDAPRPSALTRHQTDSVLTRMDRVVDSGCVLSLSFPGWWYNTLRNQFKQKEITFLVWRHRTTEWELFLDPAGRLMLADERVKTILIKDKGHYHR